MKDASVTDAKLSVYPRSRLSFYAAYTSTVPYIQEMFAGKFWPQIMVAFPKKGSSYTTSRDKFLNTARWETRICSGISAK
jgi:hypothetical protein